MEELPTIDWSELAPCPPTQRGAEILLQLLAEVEGIGGLDVDSLAHTRELAVRDAVRVGIPYRPRVWFGACTLAERKAWSRASRRLESDGHVVRIVEPTRNRVTHVVPTPAGVAWALDAAPGASRAAVAEGLRRVAWGAEILEFTGLDSPTPEFRR